MLQFRCYSKRKKKTLDEFLGSTWSCRFGIQFVKYFTRSSNVNRSSDGSKEIGLLILHCLWTLDSNNENNEFRLELLNFIGQ